MQFRARRVLAVACVLVVCCLVLSGCKATSTLTVTLGENASGTVHFTLVLDEEAASIVRRDSFDTTTLTKVFDSSELKKAGFDVEVKDKTNGTSTIDIKGSYSNEEELQAALSVIAPSSVLDGSYSDSTSLLKEKQEVAITVDVPRLRKLYLEDVQIKKAVEESGIEFSEYETLINNAMRSTTFTVKIGGNDSSESEKFTGSSKKAQTLGSTQNSLRTRYVLNMAGAIVALILAGFLLWRLCRTPRVLLKSNEKSEELVNE